MELDRIIVKGARQHNLKNVTVEIPKKKLVVFTGVSGSGKSSLAFDTLYAEGQRRYVESLSAYARQFLEMCEKPLFDHIQGISPTISVEQKAASKNPRSTVGTVTEIQDYLRVLYARAGRIHCWKCDEPVRPQTSQQIADAILSLPAGTRCVLYAPLVSDRKGEYKLLFDGLKASGFSQVRVNGQTVDLSEKIALDKKRKHRVEVLADRLTVGKTTPARAAEAVELALRYGKGNLILAPEGGQESLLSEQRTCTACGISYPPLDPTHFSFNSPAGMCVECNGLGTRAEMDPEKSVKDPDLSLAAGACGPLGKVDSKSWDWDVLSGLAKEYRIDLKAPWKSLSKDQQKVILHGIGDRRIRVTWVGKHGRGTYAYRWEGVLPRMMRRMKQTQSEHARNFYSQFLSNRPCEACNGSRLRRDVHGVRVGGRTIMEASSMTIEDATAFFRGLSLEGNEKIIASEVLKEIRSRLQFLIDVGLMYLTLDRATPTLSGGEAQRIRLASQIGSELTGVAYVLDEPSIGLHQRDNQKLIGALARLRDIGNTIIVVEHDRETMESADWLIDFGPGAGKQGGEIVEEGPPAEVRERGRSITAKYLNGTLDIAMPKSRRVPGDRWIEVAGATENNLKGVDVRFPLGLFVCVTGVSGAGKSTLVNQILYPALAKHLHASDVVVGRHKAIRGLEHIDKVIDIDQTPIGRTPRSNPATYTKAFDPIRDFFATLPEAKVRGFSRCRFSFNVKGGRCESCQGAGVKTVEMHFLPDVFVPCEVCHGKRFNAATLDVRYKGKNISDVLEMTVDEALDLFQAHPTIRRVLATLADVGMGYVALGQGSPTLSGGEAQRIKLSRELAKRETGRTFYVLDEPTTGLHLDDVKKLLAVLDRLVSTGNTVVVIEHNLDVIKTADHVIDLGPEGGAAGGRIIATGTPEEVSRVKGSYTGQYLAPLLKRSAPRAVAVAAT